MIDIRNLCIIEKFLLRLFRPLLILSMLRPSDRISIPLFLPFSSQSRGVDHGNRSLSEPVDDHNPVLVAAKDIVRAHLEAAHRGSPGVFELAQASPHLGEFPRLQVYFPNFDRTIAAGTHNFV